MCLDFGSITQKHTIKFIRTKCAIVAGRLRGFRGVWYSAYPNTMTQATLIDSTYRIGWLWRSFQGFLTIHHVPELSTLNESGRHWDFVSLKDRSHYVASVIPEKETKLMEVSCLFQTSLESSTSIDRSLFTIFLSCNLQACKRYYSGLICLPHKNNSTPWVEGHTPRGI